MSEPVHLNPTPRTCERHGHTLSLHHGPKGHQCLRCHRAELPDVESCARCEIAALRRDRDELLAALKKVNDLLSRPIDWADMEHVRSTRALIARIEGES